MFLCDAFACDCTAEFNVSFCICFCFSIQFFCRDEAGSGRALMGMGWAGVGNLNLT